MVPRASPRAMSCLSQIRPPKRSCWIASKAFWRSSFLGECRRWKTWLELAGRCPSISDMGYNMILTTFWWKMMKSTHHILQPTPALKDLTCRVSIFRPWIVTFTPIPPSHPGIHHIPPASPLYSPVFLKYSIPFPCCPTPIPTTIFKKWSLPAHPSSISHSCTHHFSTLAHHRHVKKLPIGTNTWRLRPQLPPMKL